MRAALAALLIMAATPSLAQKLPEDAEPDCREGRRILRTCEPRCRKKMIQQFNTGRSSMEDLNRALNRCLDRCWGVSKAIEDCK